MKYCLECNTEYFPLYLNPSDCRNEITKQYNYFLENDKYFPCDKSCYICEINSKNCQGCNFRYLPLEDNKNTCIQYNNNKNYYDENTNQGYYRKWKSRKYLKCDISCKTCKNKFTCLECNNKEDYFSLDQEYSKCIKLNKEKDDKNYFDNEKKQGYYFSLEDKKFIKCDKECYTCNGPSNKECKSCPINNNNNSNYINNDLILINGRCEKIKECSNGFIYLEYLGECFDIKNCIDSKKNIFNSPLFSLQEFFIDYESLIIDFKLNLINECKEISNKYNFKWNNKSYEYKNANITNNNSRYFLSNEYLEEGNFKFIIDIFYENILIQTINQSFNLIYNKVNNN